MLPDFTTRTAAGGSKKSFWERPEGRTGMMLLGAGIAVALYVFVRYDILGHLIRLTENAIHLTILGAILVGLWWLIMAERPRTLITLAFRLIARWITSLFITLDPIGIIREAVAEMKKYKARVDNAIEGLNGARRALQKDIQTMTSEMGDSLRLAQAAKSTSNLEAFGAHATIAGRKERSIENTRRNLAEIERAIEQMKRVQRHVDNKILVAEEEAKDLERQFKSAQKVKAATGAAKKALGGSDLIRLKDDAADYVREFYANELGALETLTEMLEFGNTLDLQDIAFQQDGMARLAEIERMMNQLEAGPIAPKQIVPGSPTAQAEQRELDPTSSRWTQHIREPRE